jgi:hypothetical protein
MDTHFAALIAGPLALDKAPSLTAKRSRGSFPQLFRPKAIRCTPIVPTHAGSSAPTSASASRCPAGSIASATMAACCSSICATITASPRSSPTRQRAASSILEHLRRIGGDDRRRGRLARAGSDQPQSSDRRDRGGRRQRHGPVVRRGAAAAGRRRGRLSRGDPPSLPLSSTCAASGSTPTSCCAPGDRLDPPADDRPGASPSSRPRSSPPPAPRARATIWSRAASIPASSTRSRRRRRCSSN